MTVLFAFAAEQEMVFLLATRARDVLQVACHVLVGWEHRGAPVHGHALAAVDGGSVSGFACFLEPVVRDSAFDAVREVHASRARFAGGDDFERHAVFDGTADLVAYASRIGSADDLVSGSDVESVAQTAELGRIAFASSLRASFEDETLVDVAYLRVRAGEQKRGFAECLPFDAHLVRLFLQVDVLAPVDTVVLHVFVDESAAFVDARLVQPVAALTQPERRVGLAFPTSSGIGTVRIVRPFLGFAGEPPEAGQSFAFPVPVGVAEHASGSGDGVELFGVAGEDDLGSMEFGEFGDPLQESGVGHARPRPR